jgi:hypothetical protein
LETHFLFFKEGGGGPTPLLESQVEAYAALGDYEGAAAALESAGRREPPFAKTPEFKSMAKQLGQLLEKSNRSKEKARP